MEKKKKKENPVLFVCFFTLTFKQGKTCCFFLFKVFMLTSCWQQLCTSFLSFNVAPPKKSLYKRDK